MSDKDFVINSILENFRNELEDVDENELLLMQEDFDKYSSTKYSFSIETDNVHINSIWKLSSIRQGLNKHE
jgi:hypothetical protein